MKSSMKKSPKVAVVIVNKGMGKGKEMDKMKKGGMTKAKMAYGGMAKSKMAKGGMAKKMAKGGMSKKAC